MYEKGSGSQHVKCSDFGDNELRRPVIHGAVEGSNCSNGSRRSTSSRAEEGKLCKCGRGYCKVLTSKKVHSAGRRFYCCPHSSGVDNHGCGMFEWVVEDGGPSTDTVGRIDAEGSSQSDMIYNSSVYARGYLDGIIRGSEQQIHALKDVVAALKKLDVNKK